MNIFSRVAVLWLQSAHTFKKIATYLSIIVGWLT